MFIINQNAKQYDDFMYHLDKQIRRSKMSWFISMCVTGILIGALALVGMWAYRLYKKAEQIRKIELGRYEIIKKQYPLLNPYLYEIIYANSVENHIPVRVICAIIDQESDWKQYATSPAGAKGYMQLMPETAQSLKITDLYDAQQNIRGGVQHYAFCLSKAQGDHVLALKYYNGGQNRKIFTQESENYARACMARIDKSKQILMALM